MNRRAGEGLAVERASATFPTADTARVAVDDNKKPKNKNAIYFEILSTFVRVITGERFFPTRSSGQKKKKKKGTARICSVAIGAVARMPESRTVGQPSRPSTVQMSQQTLGQINVHPASENAKRVKKVRLFVFECRVCLNTAPLSWSLASGESPRPVCDDGAPSSACKPKRRHSSLYRLSLPEAVFGQA